MIKVGVEALIVIISTTERTAFLMCFLSHMKKLGSGSQTHDLKNKIQTENTFINISAIQLGSTLTRS